MKSQKGLYVFIFGRKRITEDLLKLGMSPRKSLDLKFPDIPKEYMRDFIRGVFDGDGSVFYVKGAKKAVLQCKFFSGSERFMQGLKSALEVLGMPEKRIIVEQRKNPFYYLRYNHKESLKLFEILYHNIKNNLYLERKHNKFVAAMEVHKNG